MRGGLTAFNFDPSQFEGRANAFIKIFDKSAFGPHQPWQELTGALLTWGSYAREDLRDSSHRTADFGAPKNDGPWRSLFRGRKNELVHPLARSLNALLDAVISGETPAQLIATYVANPSTSKDWRYYFVKYAMMRSGASGRYTISPEAGYQACMLDKERLTSNYYDPYLLALVQLSGIDPGRIANSNWPRSFTGFETVPRYLTLKNSGTQIRCVNAGWEIIEPEEEHWRESRQRLVPAFGADMAGNKCLVPVPQQENIDSVDRIELGGRLLHQLIEAGL